MRKVLVGALAAIFAVGISGVQPHPVEASHVDGWKHWPTTTKASFAKTFTDKKSWRTIVALDLQKRAGPKKCVANITVKRPGYSVARFGPVYKYARTVGKRKFFATRWLNSSNKRSRVTVTIKTNGRCKYKLWAQTG